MLKVSVAQFAALEEYFIEEFAERMTGVLFRSFPADCAARGRGEVLAFVQASVGRARALGATQETDLNRYVVTEFVVGTAAMPEMLEVERKRLLEKEGTVDVTILIFLTYQAMLARISPEPQGEPEPQEEYEVIA